MLGLALFIPLLTWLASSHKTPWAHVELQIPGPAVEVPQISTVPPAKKYPYATNDEAGSYGIHNAPGFIFREQVAGWSTPSESDAANGYPKGTVQKALLDQGYKDGLKPITMDVIFNGTFTYRDEDLAWIKEDPDEGVFAKRNSSSSDIVLEDVTHARKERTGKGEVAPGGGQVVYVRGADVRDAKGNPLEWTSFRPSPDMSHVLFFADTQPIWRWSKRHNVYVHDVQAKKTYALGGGPTYPPTIAHAAWIPNTSAGVAYVQNNNLFVSFDPKSTTRRPIQITQDGTDTIFNAATDWAYEEEVFSTDHALWFSPNGTRLAYLRFDETKVPIYEYPVYNNDNGHAGKAPNNPYNKWIQMKYPKPGFANPIVSAHMVDLQDLRDSDRVSGAASSPAVYELQSPSDITPAGLDQAAHAVDLALAGDARARQDRLVTAVAWLDEDHVYLRETNRVSDKMRGVVFDARRQARDKGMLLTGQVVRRQDARDGSWLEANQDMVPLAKQLFLNGKQTSAYLDILPNGDGYNHIAFFANATASQPSFLTNGHWEVDAIEHVDLKRSKVYFSAGYPQPYRRHILTVDLPALGTGAGTSTVKAAKVGSGVVDLRPDEPTKSFSAHFDPKGAYYVMHETGPHMPRTDVFGVDDPSFKLELTANDKPRSVSSQHVRSQHVYYEVTLPDGSTTTVQEIRPHDFDSTGTVRYPVLYNVYGGPNSQKVTHEWRASEWHEYVANQLGYIVAIVDGRGTGFRGQAYRDPITGAMGTVEISDLIETARKMRGLPYVDEKRLGIWGWSYGGYFTAKVIEADSGVLNLGMSVAPVTNWRFYDSIYTERYMKDPTTSVGQERYANSSVHVTDGFRHSHYLLAQGSGDDNVHFQNSAHLIDLLTSEHIHHYAFRMFTDSSHSISTRGAYRELHEFMTEFLKNKWGAGGKRKFEKAKGKKQDVETHLQRRRGRLDVDRSP